ncbi:MAG: hypothetical protein KDC38_04960, partial [Planctomycetes bacterium]|nr:hypothetical protein [Planctomycetota bacterium]
MTSARPAPSPRPGARRLEVDPSTGDLKIVFPYDPDLLPVVRALPGRRWRPEGRYWSVGAENADSAARTLLEYGFEASTELRERLGGSPPAPADSSVRREDDEASDSERVGRGLIPALPRRYEATARDTESEVHEETEGRPQSLSVSHLNEWVRAKLLQS